jgi:hypothetical protein
MWTKFNRILQPGLAAGCLPTTNYQQQQPR